MNAEQIKASIMQRLREVEAQIRETETNLQRLADEHGDLCALAMTFNNPKGASTKSTPQPHAF